MGSAKAKSYSAGSYFYIEGDDDSDSVFIIEKGSVELNSSEGKVKKSKTVLTDGDIFGFIGCLSQRSRLETAQAVSDTSVIPLKREAFINLLQNRSEIAVKITNYFARELRIYDEMIFAIKDITTYKSGEVPDEKDELYNLGSFYNDQGSYQTSLYIFTKYLELYPQGKHIASVTEALEFLKEKGFSNVEKPILDGMDKFYHKNQIIFCEGEPGDELYIIKQGTVKISKQNNKTDMTLSILRPGDIFGELAIVSEKYRNATAIAFEETVLLPITRDSLLQLMKKSPDILKRIFEAISNRVWFTYIRLEAALYSKPITRLYAFLESKLLENRVTVATKEAVTLSHGIDELLSMAGLSHERDKETVAKLLEDKLFSFNFGQIVIHNPGEVIHKSRFYKKRDLLDD
jgi:CRP-like cAMP-binding protein